MFFLIGVIIFIVFIVGLIIYIRLRIRNVLNKAGFIGMNLGDVIREARLEDQETPKSLASMDRIYLEQIKRDFPNLNINQLKRLSEKVIIDVFDAIEKCDSSKLKGKIKSFADNIISDNKDNKIKYDDLRIHNTVISDYKCDKGVATIYFSSSFQYMLEKNGKREKVQDRVRLEFIYVIDETKLKENINVIGIHCPNCGSPITTLGEKSCSYCGSAVLELIDKVFVCNDIVRY